MEPTDLTTFIQTHLSNPPKPWLRIHGTRKSSTHHETPDFDVKIPCSAYTSLFEIELEASPFSGRQKLDVSECQSEEDAIERAASWVRSSFGSELEGRGLSIHKLLGNYSSSFPLIVAQVRDIATRIGYEGHVAVSLHDYFVPEVACMGDAEEGALLEASWGFEWPASKGGEGERSWVERIGCAMVRGERGCVDLKEIDKDMEVLMAGRAFGLLEKGGLLRESFSEVRLVDGLSI